MGGSSALEKATVVRNDANYATPADVTGRALATDLAGHVAQSYHSGGVTYVKWNGVAWPSTRPSSAGLVIILGATTGAGNVAPTWMTINDVFLTPDSTGTTTSYIAANDFEGYLDQAVIHASEANGSGTVLDVVSLSTGGLIKAVANTTGGQTRVAQFSTSTTAGTTWAGFRGGVGMKTSGTVGCRWINPLIASPFGGNNMQLLRLRRDTTGAGAYVTAPAIRLNGSTLKFELLGADGLVAWTSSSTVFNGTVGTPPAYYDLELRFDCAATHLQMFITPAGAATETVGDMTTVKNTGVQIDEYAIGVLSSFASQTASFDWLRVADVATRVNQ